MQPRVHTPEVDRSQLARPGKHGAGRLTSEDYGRGLRGMGPGVREIYHPGIKPLNYPSEQQIRARSRPKSATIGSASAVMTSDQQCSVPVVYEYAIDVCYPKLGSKHDDVPYGGRCDAAGRGSEARAAHS